MLVGEQDNHKILDYNHIDGSTCYRNLKNKIRQMMNKIVILGGAESGVGAAVLAKEQGFDVFVSDMVFVSPRPERKFSIDRIMLHDKRDSYCYQVRPGVTSDASLYNGRVRIFGSQTLEGGGAWSESAEDLATARFFKAILTF